MTNEEKPILLPLHPKELSDEEFSAYEAEFEKILSDPFRGAPLLGRLFGTKPSSPLCWSA